MLNRLFAQVGTRLERLRRRAMPAKVARCAFCGEPAWTIDWSVTLCRTCASI